MPSLDYRWRPKNSDEFIGETSVLEDLREYVRNSYPVILHGNPGTGKSSAVYIVAEELGYEVDESNASVDRTAEHIENLKSRFQTKPLFPTLFFLDEADSMDYKTQLKLTDAIETTTQPIVLAVNEIYKVAEELRKLCKPIEVKISNKHLPFIVNRMKEIAKKEGRDVTYEGVTIDIRSSINQVFYGSYGYEPEISDFEKVSNVFKKGEINDVPLIWLLDNVDNYYSGFEIYEVIRILSLVDKTGDRDLLSCLPKAKFGKAEYPYYLRKVRSKNGYHRKVQNRR